MNIGKTAVHIYAAMFFAVLALAVFSDVFFLGVQRAVLPNYSEAFSIVMPPKLFAACEIMHGRFPFWNPQLQCGYPFFALPESAVFYPINAVFAFFPPITAMNLSAVISLGLAGFMVYLWGASRGLSPVASVVSGVVFALGAPQFLYGSLGAYSNINTVIWVPLIFIAVDKIVQRPSFWWIMAGAVGILLQIFAGHAQFIYYTGFAAVLYLVLGLTVAKASFAKWVKAFSCFAAMYVVGCALAAVQLIPMFLSIFGSVRGSGVSFKFAKTFSFPPENLMSLIAPGFFGDNVSYPYWGRWFFWEASMTIGVSGLFLAAIAAVSRAGRSRAVFLPMAIACAILAMGAYTPVFKLAYDFVPGFSFLRGTAKFSVFVTLFLAAMVAEALDRIINGGEKGGEGIPESVVCAGPVLLKHASIAAYASAIILLALATAIKSPFSKEVSDMWGNIIGMCSVEERWPFFVAYHRTLGFIRDSGIQAWKSLLYATGVMAVLAAAFFASVKTKKAVYAIAFILVAESLVFSAHHRMSANPEDMGLPRQIKSFFAERPGDYRILWLGPRLDAYAAAAGLNSMWGSIWGDKRFAEFMFLAQGYPVEAASTWGEILNYSPLYKMLRCGYVVACGDKVPPQPLPLIFKLGEYRIYKAVEMLPVACLIDKWKVAEGRDGIFEAMKDPSFDPAREAILGESIGITPKEYFMPGPPGDVKVESALPGRFVLSARLDRPALLVMSERHDTGWRVRDIRPGVLSARKYRVIPANYVLLAVPLDAGEHRIIVEYVAPGFTSGVCISLVTLVLICAVATVAWKKKRGSGK